MNARTTHATPQRPALVRIGNLRVGDRFRFRPTARSRWQEGRILWRTAGGVEIELGRGHYYYSVEIRVERLP